MMNLDRAGLQYDGFAVARQVIGAFALDLDRGVLRRDLLDHAGKLRQQGHNGLGGWPEVASPDHPALDIVGIALLAPADREAVALAAVHDEWNRLGGLAQRDRQAAGRKRIE